MRHEGYVGSSRNPRRRVWEHMHDYGFSRRCAWMTDLKNEGLSPVLTILCEVHEAEAAQAETDAITMCKAIRGEHCLNGATPISEPEEASVSASRSHDGRSVTSRINGLLGGRPKGVMPVDMSKYRLLRLGGLSDGQIANALGISVRTLKRRRKEQQPEMLQAA